MKDSVDFLNLVNESSSIEQLRVLIDDIDKDICKLLSRRFLVSGKIGELKSISGQGILDISREEKVIKNSRLMFNESARHLDNKDNICTFNIEGLMEFIMKESKRLQKNN